MRVDAEPRAAFHAPPSDRLAAVSAKPLSSATLIIYSLALALGIGVGSVYWTVRDGYPLGEAQIGPWKTWPRVGSREADPYALSVVARTGEIPLGLGEGLALTAAADDAGQPLQSHCTYRIGSATPQARHWTLTAYGPDQRLLSTDLGRTGFTSTEVLRETDGSFWITLSRDLSPGNWLKLPSAGEFTLVIRLYDTPVAAGSAALEAHALPSIQRLGCAA